MSKTINVGLIGYGMGGKVFHAPVLITIRGLNLCKIRETKPNHIAHAQLKYPQAQIVADVEEIIHDPQIDLVIITIPNHLHFSLAKDALMAGKHVVLDKPFTVTTAEADELIVLAQTKNKVLSVYQNRRFDSDFKTVQKVIDSKVLGNLVEYEVHYDRFRNFIRKDTWKEEDSPGSGLLYDLGAHLIDQAQLLFGLPLAVFADIRTQRKAGRIVDNFELILNYPDLKVTLKSGMLVKEGGPKILLLGDQGSFLKYGMDVQEADLIAGLTVNDKEHWGVEPESLWGTLHTKFKGITFRGKVESEKGDYNAYYANIYKVLIGEETLLIKPEQARNTIRIIETALKSVREKRWIEF